MSSRVVRDYYIGWICALNIELTAAIAMLDKEHGIIAGQDSQDHNSYILGRIHQHNVVITRTAHILHDRNAPAARTRTMKEKIAL